MALDDRKQFEQILEEIATLRAKKNSDYGSSFYDAYDDFGMIGVTMDLGRKYNRIKIFSKKKELLVEDETIEDTLRDLALISINALLWFRNSK